MSDYIPDSAASASGLMIDPRDDIDAFMDEVLDWRLDDDLGEAVPHLHYEAALDGVHHSTHDEDTCIEALATSSDLKQFITPQAFAASARTVSGMSSDGPCVLLSTIGDLQLQHPKGPPDIVSFADSQCRATRRRQCPHEACTYDGKDLGRHVRTVHERRRPFLCPAKGCFKKQNATAFARAYSLTSHLRASHAQGKNLRCPGKYCVPSDRTLESLAIHIALEHPYSLETGLLSAIEAAGLGKQRCPVCKEHFVLAMFTEHVMSHHHEVILAATEDLLLMGYAVVECKAGEELQALIEPDAQFDLPTGTIAGIKIVCPICSVFCDDHLAFEAHVDMDHIVSSDERQHFRSWRAEFQRRRSQSYNFDDRGNSTAFLDWPVWDDWTIICPHCRKSEYGWRHGHHLDMLAPVDEIKTFRLRILRHYPQFIEYKAVWDDYP